MRLKRLLAIWANALFVTICVAFGASEVRIDNAPASSFADGFKRGLIYGHAGLLFQQSIGANPYSTYGDINLSLGYETRRFMGYKFGAEMWIVPKLYEANTGDFARSQTYFEVPQIYADFYNEYESFGGIIGRFKTDEDWITNYTEGLSASYDRVKNLSLNFTWALRNAFFTNYFAQNFQNFGDYQSGKIGGFSGGAFLFRADFAIPQASITLSPYLYMVPDFFVAPGLKTKLDLPINQKLFFRALIHLTSYVGVGKQASSTSGGGGGIIWGEAQIDWGRFVLAGQEWQSFLTAGVGIINTPSKGALYIDSFGQNTPFERADGIFYYNSTTPYAFVSVNLWKYVSLYGAFRTSIVSSNETVLNWEGRVDFRPIKNVLLGASALGVNNSVNIRNNRAVPTRFGPSGDYTIFRGYVEYKF
ncbi:Opr family porin [Helicobacter sp. T3_23-1059]